MLFCFRACRDARGGTKKPPASLPRSELSSRTAACTVSGDHSQVLPSSMFVGTDQIVAPSVATNAVGLPQFSTTNQPLVEPNVTTVSQQTNVANANADEVMLQGLTVVADALAPPIFSQPRATSQENLGQPKGTPQPLDIAPHEPIEVTLANLKMEKDEEDAAAGLMDLFNSASSNLSHLEDPDLQYSCGSLNYVAVERDATRRAGSYDVAAATACSSPPYTSAAHHLMETSKASSIFFAMDSSLQSLEYKIDEEHPPVGDSGDSLMSFDRMNDESINLASVQGDKDALNGLLPESNGKDSDRTLVTRIDSDRTLMAGNKRKSNDIQHSDLADLMNRSLDLSNALMMDDNTSPGILAPTVDRSVLQQRSSNGSDQSSEGS